jgi:hypothetical protein
VDGGRWTVGRGFRSRQCHKGIEFP